MKYFSTILPFLLLPLVLNSCEKMFTSEFNPLGKLDDKGKILIESILESGQDTLRIRSGITTFLKNKNTSDASQLHMDLKINGKDIEIYEDNTSPKQFNNQKNFYALCPLHSGDVIELNADSPGTDPATVKTTMGAAIPEVTIDQCMEWTDKTIDGIEETTKSERRKFTITLDEEPQANSLFAVQVIRRLELIGHDDNILVGGIGTHYNVNIMDELYTLEHSDFPMSGRHYDLSTQFQDADMQVFDDYYVNEEGKMCLSIYVFPEEFWRMSPSLYVQPKYKFIISRISREMYNCIKKNNTVEGLWGLWKLGTGPHAYSYTNIKGGIGILGTKNNYTSEWILIPEIKYE